MSRTKLFISYSQRDRDWLDLVMLHLGVLQRRGLVHVWSDRRIEVGAPWKDEIERALTDSRIAVLLVSPGFLASTFIWKEEMPKIVAHQKAGMEVLPLIIKPCAWHLENVLSRLQVRPPEATPLSLGSEAQVDLHLAAFVYEIAAKINATSATASTFAAQAWDLARRHAEQSEQLPLNPRVNSLSRRAAATSLVSPLQLLERLPRSWTGTYKEDVPFRLTIQKRTGQEFRGIIEYVADDTATAVEGSIIDLQTIAADERWSSLGDERPAGCAIVFREVKYRKQGARKISFKGEYLAYLSERDMAGGWFSGTRLVGGFLATLDGVDELAE
jgi:hypothetical protein